ncbi:MAG: hypothetical protein A3I66_04640 [Burkholderiales bacterium RIFCSPLOWO2_02_FULL_57_36]|nr:MAG: hypothetical protein A3I66_04640 [Burkholderiales bacterium RIFCSPLOWO2_02_FULL_57_36]
MKTKYYSGLAAAGMSMLMLAPVHAVRFESGSIEGSFDSSVTVGAGRRMQNPSCSIVGDANACGAAANTAQWSGGDDGNLNYRKGDFFTAYIKGNHELLLKGPEGWKFMARGAWLKDFKADDTRRTDLSGDARSQIVNHAELLDLWISKDFSVGEQNGRVRFGRQVISWGESLYFIGGISNNVLDFQKLAVPGTQLKEAFLPVSALSIASSLGNGVSGEAYIQFQHRRARVAPVGSYFSASDYYGKGRVPLSYSGTNFNVTGPDQYTASGQRRLSDQESINAIAGNGNFPIPIGPDAGPGKSGQFGLSLRYTPSGTDLDLGVYAANYHDQFPVINALNGGTELQWQFLKNRRMYGATANFPLGNWAVGTEFSYRPKDAVTLSNCFAAGSPELDVNLYGVVGLNNCPLHADSKKYQLSVTGLLQLQKHDGAHKVVLDLLGADSASFIGEVAVTRYPNAGKRFTRNIEGTMVDQVAAAGYFIPLVQGSGGYPIAARFGTPTSWGYVMDFNWTYDGSLISGWQVTPGVTFSHAVKGDTPNYAVQFLEGNKSANFYVLFNQNPTKWQAGINYTRYFGGKNDLVDRQYLKDRDFIGAFATYHF